MIKSKDYNKIIHVFQLVHGTLCRITLVTSVPPGWKLVGWSLPISNKNNQLAVRWGEIRQLLLLVFQ